MIRALTPDEIASAEFAHLLWLAAEPDDAGLRRIVGEELPGLQVLGVLERGRVTGFVAFDADAEPLTVEYLAVHEDAQGRGRGSALIRAVRETAPGRTVHAETDDDAVDFYRRLGFAVTAKDPDPRWPERRRYACTLT